MTDCLARRGPDASGIEKWPRAVLGHRRLSIFDLSSAGLQPMLSPDRSIGVVFNGAIYNFPSLRSELEQLGYRFLSQTDTEVIVHGYDAWGIDKLVSKLRGMFAIGLWDNRAEKLILIRDRLGVKPLIFASDGAHVAFASTVRAVASSGLTRGIDSRAIAEFLEFGFITDGRTVYENVHKVPAATIIEFSNGHQTRRTYWQSAQADEDRKISFEEAVDQAETSSWMQLSFGSKPMSRLALCCPAELTRAWSAGPLPSSAVTFALSPSARPATRWTKPPTPLLPPAIWESSIPQLNYPPTSCPTSTNWWTLTASRSPVPRRSE